MILRIGLCLALLSALAPAASSDPIVEEKRESSVTITRTDGVMETSIVNRRFEPAMVSDDRSGQPKLVYYLLSVEIERKLRDAPDQETEFLQSIARVTAQPIGENGLEAPTLKMEADGDEVAISGPFVIVTRWGCCAFQASYAAYSILGGAKLFSATGVAEYGQYGQWVTLGSRRRPDEARYVAAHVAPTMADAVELGDDPSHVIAIAYAGGEGLRQRLIVTLDQGRDSDQILDWLPKLSWVTKEQPDGTDHVFFQSDAPAAEIYSGITLRLQLDQSSRIEIPLEKDRLAADKATLPQGFGLVESQP